MTASISNLSAIAADLNAAGKEVTVTRLRTRGPRKGETMQRNSQHGRGAAMGSVQSNDRQTASHAVGAGKGGTITRVTGLGSQWVGDKDANAAAAAAQYAADRRAAARDRLMEKIDSALAL